MNHLFKSFFAAGAAFVTLCATAGQDLPINGDFYGAPSRHHIVPGWRTLTPGGARLFPWRNGKQVLELSSRRNPKVAVSEMHQAGVGLLEIDADVSGRGTVSLGFEAYDASRRVLIQNGKQSWPLSGVESEIKFAFQLTDPRIAFVRITLTAEPGSVARIRDVDAELKYAPAPVPAAPLPPPPAPAAAVPAAQMLMNDGFYALESLPAVAVFQASVYAGKDIDFKLGEHHNQMWNIAPGYDARVCRVELERKFKHGMRYLKVELNGMYRGTTNVEFVNTNGKRVIVQFTSL